MANVKKAAVWLAIMALCVGSLSVGCSDEERPTDSTVSSPGEMARYETVFGPETIASLFMQSGGASGELHDVEDRPTEYDNTVVPAEPSKLPGYPQAADSDYPSDDVLIYAANVLDYGAKADGVTDDTGAVQQALNRVGSYGGGTVYMPAGTYRFDGTLRIPHAVTLRGDFCSPQEDAAPGAGTVLLIYSGKGQENGTPAIRMGVSAALCGVTIYYPEQNYADVQVYPATVSNDHADAKYGGHSATVRDVWFVNSYYIADMGTRLDSSLHTAVNIYGTPLRQGFEIDRMYDIGRMEGIYFTPQYLLRAAERGIAPAMTQAEYDQAAAYVYENAVGISVYKSDWEYIYNYNAHGLHTAIEFEKSKTGDGDGQISHMTSIDCRYGILAGCSNVMGWSVSNSWFTAAADADSYGAATANNSGKGLVLFENCRFAGGGAAFYARNAMDLSFTNCVFEAGEEGAGFQSTGKGGYQLLQCTFEGAGVPVQVNERVRRIQVLGCSFADASRIQIDKDNAIAVTVDHTPQNLPKQSGTPHQYKITPPRPSTNHVYYLYDYGAKADTDITGALRSALAAAGETGGTVYLPPGKFILSGSVTVPSGVELRGCLENAYHPQNLLGTTLLAKVPAGEEQEPLIRLSANAGVKGFSVCYPDQFGDDFAGGNPTPYAWTIRSEGEGTWAIAVCLVNSYLGMDFGTYPSAGHYIRGVTGAPLKVGIFAGSNSGNGWVENVHFNPGLGNENTYYSDMIQDRKAFTTCMLNHLTAFQFGYNEAEHLLGNFVYAARNGIQLIAQEGKAFNGRCIGLGVDNSIHSIDIEQCDTVEFVNTELTVITHPEPIRYLNVASSNTGKVGIFNSRLYGQRDAGSPSMVVDGRGSVTVQLCYFMESGSTVYRLQGGATTIAANIFQKPATHVEANGRVTAADLIGNAANPPVGLEASPGMEMLTIADSSGGKLRSYGSLLR